MKLRILMVREVPSQTLIFSGSSITPAPGGAKNRVRLYGELGATKINLLPLGLG